jgi:hypothetical protein
MFRAAPEAGWGAPVPHWLSMLRLQVRRENQGQHRHLLSHPVAGRTFGNRPIAVKARAVSDPCPACRQGRLRVHLAEPVVMRTAGIGASLPLDAGVKNEEVCPLSDLRADRFERLSRVESGCGAVAVGRACLFPPLSSGGALVARP